MASHGIPHFLPLKYSTDDHLGTAGRGKETSYKMRVRSRVNAWRNTQETEHTCVLHETKNHAASGTIGQGGAPHRKNCLYTPYARGSEIHGLSLFFPRCPSVNP